MITLELRTALTHPNLQAFLRMVRVGEGTADEDGPRRMFGGELVADLAAHPRRAVTRKLGGKPITSTAAGAYQFLSRTWDECVAALGLTDFSMASQNLAAAWLIRRRGALQLVLDGRITDAIDKCNREWASLPGSPYGQPTLTTAKALAAYVAAGGTFNGMPAPADTSAPNAVRNQPTFFGQPTAQTETQPRRVGEPPVPERQFEAAEPVLASLPPLPKPTPTPTAPQEPRTMPPIIAAFLPALVARIPELAGLMLDAATVDPKKQQAAQLALTVVTQALGARNAQEAAELVASDPAAAQAAQNAVRGQWFEIQSAGEEAIGAARLAMAEHDSRTDVRTVLGSLSFHEVLSLYLITICAVGAGWVLGWSDLSSEVKTAVVTLMIIGGYSGVRDFWFGSSHGSKTKDGRGGM